MLQINYFKYTRIKTGTEKRIFKMAPIHHHFEMSGMSENHIVALFTLITVITSIVAFIALLVTYRSLTWEIISRLFLSWSSPQRAGACGLFVKTRMQKKYFFYDPKAY